jgi:hypothetical protein
MGARSPASIAGTESHSAARISRLVPEPAEYGAPLPLVTGMQARNHPERADGRAPVHPLFLGLLEKEVTVERCKRSGRCHQVKLSRNRRTQQNLPFVIRPSKNVSRPRATSGSTSIRSGSGTPSTATRCCPCARSYCSPSPPQPAALRPAPGADQQPCDWRDTGILPASAGEAPPRRPRPCQGQRPRSPPPAPPGHHADDRHRPPARPRVVTMVAKTPGPRPLPPLPGTAPA